MKEKDAINFFTHTSAIVDKSVRIGEGTKIWHFSHVMSNATIGKNCVLGQNVFIADKVTIGNNVKIQNNVSVYQGVTVEDDVFLGPSMVFTNVLNPRSFIERKTAFQNTLVRKGATIGANATIVCGNDIGRYAFVGAGCVVTKPVPDFALVVGNPGKQIGWMSKAGHQLIIDQSGIGTCPETSELYELSDGQLTSLKP